MLFAVVPVTESPAGKPVADSAYGATPPAAVHVPEYGAPAWVGPALGAQLSVSGDVVLPIVNASAFETARPGFTTVIVAVPGVAIRLAGTLAWSSVSVPPENGSSWPFQ